MLYSPHGYAPMIFVFLTLTLRSRLSRMPHGRHIKEERKEIRIGNFSLDGRSHQTGDAAFTPATPHDLHHSRANKGLTQLTQHATHEIKTKYFLLYATTLNFDRNILEDTSHRTRPKSMRMAPLSLWGVYTGQDNTRLSLVVSYSDASASSPGFTVTDSILLGGKVGIRKQARELVIMSEPKSTGHPPHPACRQSYPR